MRWTKEPLIQFLVLGALIFFAYNFSQKAENQKMDKSIVIDAPTQAWMYDNFRKQFQRPPTRMEMGHLIKAHVDEEVKYRHALAMGLDDRDSIVRRRMTQKMDFLFGNSASDTLPESDVLEQWYLANANEFRKPPTITFIHVWFSPDKRGDDAHSDAEAALQAIDADQSPTGDRFPFNVAFDDANFNEVRNVLGPGFARAAFELPVNQWSGPVPSGLGHHLVHVTDIKEGTLPPIDEIHDLVLQRWREVESERIFDDMVTALKDEFEIEINEDSLIQFEYAPDEAAITP